MIREITFVSIGLLAATVVSGQGRLQGRGTARRFVSEKYRFSIAVPLRWLVDPANDTPMYFSFSPAQADEFNHQLRLPKGGAVISVLAQESLPGQHTHTLSDWALEDARADSAGTAPIRPFEIPPETGATEALISSYDTPTFGPDDQSQHTVSVFWDFRGKRFVAHLLYPAHDPKGPEFERILADTVRSIRPLGKTQKQ